MSRKEIFNISGPVELTTVDWRNWYHKKSVAACLVQAAYVMELDRQKNRPRSQALAPPWWRFFHFELDKQLIDDDDAEPTVFGAVFTRGVDEQKQQRAPRCVVAFRGTTTKKSPAAFFTDFKLNLRIMRNALQESPRFRKALEAVRAAVKELGAENVWIAGHSLGAAIALLAGKAEAKGSVLLENAFLFNPPFVSLRIIRTSAVRSAIRFIGNVVTDELAELMGRDEEAPFEAWSTWHPRLFLNPLDHLCLEYINYFEQRKIWKASAQQSMVSVVLGAIDPKWGEATHLIPSAHVTINHTTKGRFKDAHGIHQWWKPNLCLESKKYTFPNQS